MQEWKKPEQTTPFIGKFWVINLLIDQVQWTRERKNKHLQDNEKPKLGYKEEFSTCILQPLICLRYVA